MTNVIVGGLDIATDRYEGIVTRWARVGFTSSRLVGLEHIFNGWRVANKPPAERPWLRKKKGRS